VLAAPTEVNPVPPIDTGAVFAVTPVAKLTDPLANLPDVIAESAISAEGIVLLAIFAFTRPPAVIEAPVKFFNV